MTAGDVMVKRCLRAMLMLFPLLFSAPHLLPADEAPTVARPDALLVYPGATQVSFENVGPLELDYRVAAKFPAGEVIRWLSAHLEANKWNPLKYDLLNPDRPSSQVGGWIHFMDPRNPARKYVYSWDGHWMDGSGDGLSYILQYHSSTESAPKSTDLVVSAVYSTAVVIKQHRELYEKLYKRHRQPEN